MGIHVDGRSGGGYGDDGDDVVEYLIVDVSSAVGGGDEGDDRLRSGCGDEVVDDDVDVVDVD